MSFTIIDYLNKNEIPEVCYRWTNVDSLELQYGDYLKTKDSIKRVVETIAQEKNLIHKSRIRRIVDQRKYLYHVLRDKGNLTLSDIGRIFERDHTTILHNLKSFDEIKDFPDFQENARELINTLSIIEPLKKQFR